METRRLLLTMFGAMAVYFIAMLALDAFNPPPERPPAQQDGAPAPRAQDDATGERETAPPSGGQPQDDAQVETSAGTPDPDRAPDARLSAEGGRPYFEFTPAGDVVTHAIGGGPDDSLRMSFTSRGAAVESIWLTARKSDDPDAPYLFAETPEGDEPYHLIRPVEVETRAFNSFATHRVTVLEHDDTRYTLANLNWEQVSADEQHVAYQTTLRQQPSGEPILTLTKRYTLRPGKPLVDLTLEAESHTEGPLTLTFAQDGAVGIPREQSQWDQRRLMIGARTGTTVSVIDAPARGELYSGTVSEEPETFSSTPEQQLLWSALTNRFFGVFVRQVKPAVDEISEMPRIEARVATTLAPKSAPLGDLLARHVLDPIEVAPMGKAARQVEIYAGAKDADRLVQAGEAYVDETQLGYITAQYADSYCMCTFDSLTRFMTWLLHTIYAVVPNYGVAIIVLVIIVRTLLHPLTVFQQRAMFKTQEAMSHVQPKLAAIKEKYGNDRQKQNQEMMKLMAEEGVNPLANFVGFIPMFIQMPILVALWRGLNADVELRHAGFVGWINDLSTPDQFIIFQEWFGSDLTIPLLGWLIPSMFANIPALNILPLIMGVSMYFQQKYMPKPGMAEKREQARKRAEESGKESDFERQMKQQQTMMTMMSVIFPLMFYYMPSGLTLYWLATNVFGITETLIIRRQIQREKAAKAARGPEPPKKPKKSGVMSKIFSKMAQQAEELQRKADELSQQEAAKKAKKGAQPKADKPQPPKSRKREKTRSK